MSAKFSGEGREIIGGSKNADLICYDLAANRVSARVPNSHDDEINSVCFANRQHSNIFLSGSDDSYVKVWDRRALNDNRPVGVFVGHAEGVTNVCSKGDGIYVASNSKDQLLKVWDIRRMNNFSEW
jgi:WD repeat-containing protein 23